MISNIAEPILVKLSAIIKDISVSILAKEFFEKIEKLKSSTFLQLFFCKGVGAKLKKEWLELKVALTRVL